MKNKKLGLVFAGGGAKGAYEIGALEAIEELGLMNNINMVSGNSIGSVNLCLFAEGDVKKAKSLWQNIDPADFLAFDNNGFDITKEGDGIFSREGLIRLIKKNVDLSKVTNSDNIYYITVCTKLSDGTIAPVYVKLNGKTPETILDYIMASSAIPIVYDAVVVEGVAYFDGGLRDNTPIMPLYEEGATDIIVISNDDKYVTDDYRYPRARLYPVVPSHSLDMDTLIGTADLSQNNAYYRLKLGYLDAYAILSSYIDNKPIPDLRNNHQLATRELNMARLNSQVNDNISGLARILGESPL